VGHPRSPLLIKEGWRTKSAGVVGALEKKTGWALRPPRLIYPVSAFLIYGSGEVAEPRRQTSPIGLKNEIRVTQAEVDSVQNNQHLIS
jgi:hypothetical protein